MYTCKIVLNLFQILVVPRDYPGETSVLLLEGMTLDGMKHDFANAKSVGLVQVPLRRVHGSPFTLVADHLIRDNPAGAVVQRSPLFRRPFVVDLRDLHLGRRRYDPAVHHF